VTVEGEEGTAFDVRTAPLLAGETTSLEHRLEPGGRVVVVGEPHASFALRDEGRDDLLLAFESTASGIAGVAGAPLRRLEVVALEGGAPRMVVGTVSPTPGRLTWLDARRGGAVALSGRVLRGARPVEGALVSGLGSTDVVTGADGAYALHEPVAARVVLGSVVTPPDPDGVALRFETGCMSLGKEEIRRDFELPTATLVLAVTGRDGRPAADVVATLAADAGAGPGLEGGSAQRRTDARGVARWVGLPAGEYAAVARFPSGVLVRRTVAVADGARAEATAVEPVGAPFLVRVLDQDGRPAAAASVSVRFLAAGDDPGVGSSTRFVKAVDVGTLEPAGPDGQVRIPALAGGVALVAARRGPLEEAPPEVVAAGPSGAADVVLRLQRTSR
jgi:hypothetical protein